MNKIGGYQAKWSESEEKRQIPDDFTQMWNTEKKYKDNSLVETDAKNPSSSVHWSCKERRKKWPCDKEWTDIDTAGEGIK